MRQGGRRSWRPSHCSSSVSAAKTRLRVFVRPPLPFQGLGPSVPRRQPTCTALAARQGALQLFPIGRDSQKTPTGGGSDVPAADSVCAFPGRPNQSQDKKIPAMARRRRGFSNALLTVCFPCTNCHYQVKNKLPRTGWRRMLHVTIASWNTDRQRVGVWEKE